LATKVIISTARIVPASLVQHVFTVCISQVLSLLRVRALRFSRLESMFIVFRFRKEIVTR
jgi:hypothetical protein